MKIGNCKHCNEEFIKTRKDKVYCCPSCVTMACYERNDYKYVSGGYQKGKAYPTSKNNFTEVNSSSIEKKLEQQNKKINQLIETFDKVPDSSNIKDSTMGTLLARGIEYGGKKILAPLSINATKGDVCDLKNKFDVIQEQNNKLLKLLEQRKSFL